jgi:putative hemolysin
MASAQAYRVRSTVPRFEAGIVRDATRVAQAQRFRDSVIERQTGARPVEDRFDALSEHLVVRDTDSDELVGACRVLSPRDAMRAGGYHADLHFDTALLIVLRDRMVEIDAPCVHPHYRFENVVTHLWSALARYLIENRHDYLLGSAAVPLLDGGHVAASAYRIACARFLSPDDYRVFPRRRLPLETLSDTRAVTPPPLLKCYLELGAWVCGEPAHLLDTATAEFPILLPLARMQGRHARSFLAQAI